MINVMDETKEIDDLKRDMRMVSETAIWKAVDRCKKPENTTKPYIDFSKEHLWHRFIDELREFMESGKPGELIDIIAMAEFLYLRMTIYCDDRFPEASSLRIGIP